MPYSSTLRGERFVFPDLRDLFAKANEEKSGDQLAGIAAGSERQRVAAKMALAEVTLRQIVEQPLIDPDQDDVSRLILEQLDQAAFAEISSLTLGEFRDRLLAGEYSGDALPKFQQGITPEIVAGLAKLLSNKDLILATSTIRNITRCRNTIGEHGVLAIRVQPNHPADDVAGILLSTIDGLSFGCGDAVIGVNPAGDSVESVSAILHGLDRLITAGYKLLGLQTYFTVGPKEARAWTIPAGTCAPQAAGVIHGDFEKGFIRAETVAYDDYIAGNGEAGAKEAGRFRVEGKTYEVKDGDVLHFLFNA